MRCGLLVWLAACGADPVADRAAYLGRDCAAVQTEALRSECSIFEASELATSDPEAAREVCAGLAGRASGECYFLVSDVLETAGEAAVAACALAGDFEGQCLEHAASREVDRAVAAHGEVGDEAALAEAGQRIAAAYPALGGDPAEVGDLLVVHAIAQRMGRGVFEGGRCGAATPDQCGRAYQVSLEPWAKPRNLRSFCDGAHTPEGAEASRLRPWDADADAIVVATWGRLCASGWAPAPNVLKAIPVPSPPPRYGAGGTRRPR